MWQFFEITRMSNQYEELYGIENFQAPYLDMGSKQCRYKKFTDKDLRGQQTSGSVGPGT
jgi:hypothetical protein